jgi:hypothetical protein
MRRRRSCAMGIEASPPLGVVPGDRAAFRGSARSPPSRPCLAPAPTHVRSPQDRWPATGNGLWMPSQHPRHRFGDPMGGL